MRKLRVGVIATLGLGSIVLAFMYTLSNGGDEELADTPSSVTAPTVATQQLRGEDPLLLAVEARLGVVETRLQHAAKGYAEMERVVQGLVQSAQLPRPAIAHNKSRGISAESAAEGSIHSEQDTKRGHLTLLEADLAKQGFDPDWSRQATESIVKVLNRQELMGSLLRSVTCGKTFCRLEVQHADQTNHERFIDDFIPALAWQGSAIGDSIDHHNGTYSTVLFLSRENHPLPSSEGG